MNLISAHQKLTRFFEKKMVDSPRLTSEVLISHALNIPRIRIYASFDRIMTDNELDRLRELSRRITSGEPLQLIVGDTQFLTYTFFVESGVFIPRPETETLVEVAVNFLREKFSAREIFLLDLGTGAGVIAVSILLQIANCSAIGIDIDARAAMLARKNAAHNGVGSRLSVLQGDLFAPLKALPDGVFHCIASNPPYVRTGEMPYLDKNVRDYDPAAALDGGDEGLSAIRRIVNESDAFLLGGGMLIMEAGAGQAALVMDMMEHAGLTDISVRTDLQGIERVIAGWKK
ncbi:MAG: peptide chain release factor N(5)-glutamine methyltransferase [bacterium]